MGGFQKQRNALALYTAILIAFMAASSAPTPLYRAYQQAWGFSPSLLTVVFAAYAIALLLTLLVTGRLSDYIGRRPVVLLALALEAVAMGLFLSASGAGWLIAARIVQGIATGLAVAALGAALMDIHQTRGALINSVSPMLGMACGALGSTALLVIAPDPLHFVYIVLLALFVMAGPLVYRARETAVRRRGAWASLRPSITVPVAARRTLLAISPANMAVWMLGGFYLSLMPSLISAATHAASPWLGGFSVASLTLSGAVSVLLARRMSAPQTLLRGELALACGICLILLGTYGSWPAILIAGSILGGLGFGATFLGAVRSVMPLAPPHQRAGLMGAFYVESYLAHSVPTMAVGYLASHQGLVFAVYAYGALILLLVGLAIVLGRQPAH
jgi:hypothetical protein